MTRALRTTITLAVLAVLVVVGAAYGWAALTKPVPSLKQKISTECVPTTIAKGDNVGPDQVTISVLNASTREGLAGRTMAQFVAQGFYEGETGNAPKGTKVGNVQIWTTDRGSAAINLVKSRFKGKFAVVATPSDLPGITVVVGDDFTSLRDGKPSVKAFAPTKVCAPPS